MIAGVVSSSPAVLPFLVFLREARIFLATAPSTSITGAVVEAVLLFFAAADFDFVEVVLALETVADLVFEAGDFFAEVFLTFIFSAIFIGAFLLVCDAADEQNLADLLLICQGFVQKLLFCRYFFETVIDCLSQLEIEYRRSVAVLLRNNRIRFQSGFLEPKFGPCSTFQYFCRKSFCYLVLFQQKQYSGLDLDLHILY
jgi:hypothetical protein